MEANYTINLDNVIDSIRLNHKGAESMGAMLGMGEKKEDSIEDMVDDVIAKYMAHIDDEDLLKWDTADIILDILQTVKRKKMNDIEAFHFIISASHQYFTAIEPIQVIVIKNEDMPEGGLQQ